MAHIRITKYGRAFFSARRLILVWWKFPSDAGMVCGCTYHRPLTQLLFGSSAS